jgi:hypothetical protein
LGFPPGFAPRRRGAERRTPGWGQAIEHGPGTTRRVLNSHSLISNPVVHSYVRPRVAPRQGSHGIETSACRRKVSRLRAGRLRQDAQRTPAFRRRRAYRARSASHNWNPQRTRGRASVPPLDPTGSEPAPQAECAHQERGTSGSPRRRCSLISRDLDATLGGAKPAALVRSIRELFACLGRFKCMGNGFRLVWQRASMWDTEMRSPP